MHNIINNVYICIVLLFCCLSTLTEVSGERGLREADIQGMFPMKKDSFFSLTYRKVYYTLLCIKFHNIILLTSFCFIEIVQWTMFRN